jgi:hypothetical protein
MFPVRSQAVLKVRQRADMENSMFVTDAEIVDFLNDNLEIAYHHCVAAYGDTTFANDFVISGLGYNQPTPPTTWPTGQMYQAGVRVAEQTRFALPTDFSRLLRCEFTTGLITTIQASSGSYNALSAPEKLWTPMHPIDLQGSILDTTPRDWIEGAVGYWITSHPGPTMPQSLDPTDDSSTFWISFLPVPKSVVSVHLHYVPGAPSWGTSDTGLIRLPDLAWKYVREATAADLLEKQRSDSSALRGNASMYLADIQGSKLGPDFANPQGTVDVYGGSGISPYGRRRSVW